MTVALASAVLPTPKKDAPVAETSLGMFGEDGVRQAVDGHATLTGSDALLLFETQKIISDLLAELDWIDTALVTISSDNSAVSAVLDINREPYQHEADDVIEIITFHVNGLEKENIAIMDQNNNIVYPYK